MMGRNVLITAESDAVFQEQLDANPGRVVAFHYYERRENIRGDWSFIPVYRAIIDTSG
jgi:hypothetical protein